MKKNYQKNATRATTPVLPEAVSVAMAELAADVQEGLLAMAVGAGLQVMAAMMNADIEAVCGPKGRHRWTFADILRTSCGQSTVDIRRRGGSDPRSPYRVRGTPPGSQLLQCRWTRN